MRFADLDAVTLDAHGTLVELRDPVPALRRALAEHRIEADDRAVARAFAAEIAYYRPRGSRGRDEESLRVLREECVGVFLTEVAAGIEPPAFAEQYLAALVFEPLPGVRDALRALRARGLALAVVSNWDVSLGEELERLGLAALVDTVVTSADAAVEKPDPAIFRLALERLGVEPARALHVGDRGEDEAGAARAGLAFARTPLPGAIAGLAA
jgi:putative hydrolase of the HAD superfamily